MSSRSPEMAGASVIVGGTAGIGLEVARTLAQRGGDVGITGRDAERARSVASTLGKTVSGIGFDIAKPHDIKDALAGVGTVQNLVIGAIERDTNTVKDYNIDRAINLVTMK